MKALCIYLALTAVSVNVVGNMMAKTADGIRASQEQRVERLCQVNPAYCR